MQEVSVSLIDAIALPKIVKIGHNLYAAVFSLMKILPARYILDQAQATGLLQPGSLIIETSSGTFGLGLAMQCRLKGYRLILVSDPAIDPPFQRRLEDLGAQVEIVREPLPGGDFQGARLARMSELLQNHPDHFCPSQYDNPDNPRSYGALGEVLLKTLGEVHCIVGTVGSGGSMCGTADFIRAHYPQMSAIGVDTLGSVLFGQPDRNPRLLRGLGNSLMPLNLNHSVFDEVHWVRAGEAFAATRALHQQHAMFMGPTSGAAYLVARWWATEHPDANIVVLFPDEGYRYLDTIYRDDWLHDQNPNFPDKPRSVDHPVQAGPDWSFIRWQRRTYPQVMGSAFNREAT